MDIKDEYTYFKLFNIEERIGRSWVDEYLDLKVERQRVRVMTCLTKKMQLNEKDSDLSVRFIVEIYGTMVSIDGGKEGVSYSIDGELCLVSKANHLFLGVLNAGIG